MSDAELNFTCEEYAARIAKTRAAEQTRREIAAYVAEGSISSEDAVAMLKAGGCEVEA